MKLKTAYSRLKSRLYLLLLLSLPAYSFGSGVITDTLFAKGNQAYAKAQYGQAVQSYQQILNDGYQSANVYFNLGNAYYKLGDTPSALLYLEKAHKLNPGDEDINFNIRLARSKTTDKLDQVPEFFVTAWWHSFILSLSVNTLGILSVLLLLAGFGTLIIYLFTGSINIKRTSFFTGIVLIFIGLAAIFIANRQLYYFNHHHQAIIFTTTVTAKSSPDGNAKPLFIVHEGTEINILQTNNNRVEIELPNGNAGWIAASDIKTI